MTRIAALTGGTGFLGRHVIRALAERGWRVRMLTRRAPDLPELADIEIELVPGDLHDAPALMRLCDGAEAVIHLAGLVKAKSRAEFFRINAVGAYDCVCQPNPTHTQGGSIFSPDRRNDTWKSRQNPTYLPRGGRISTMLSLEWRHLRFPGIEALTFPVFAHVHETSPMHEVAQALQQFAGLDADQALRAAQEALTEQIGTTDDVFV